MAGAFETITDIAIFVIVVMLIVAIGGFAVKVYLAKKAAETVRDFRGTGKDAARGAVDAIFQNVGKKNGRNREDNEGVINFNEQWFYKRRNVMSQSELRFFKLLREALPHKLVLSQVSMYQVLACPPRDKAHFWRIGQKCLDIVVCNDDSSVLFVAELDDKTHNDPERQKADATKEKALRDAGVPLIRWHAEMMPTVPEIRETIRKTLTKH
jgi:Protein of unknown function (DUF2726).